MKSTSQRMIEALGQDVFVDSAANGSGLSGVHSDNREFKNKSVRGKRTLNIPALPLGCRSEKLDRFIHSVSRG